MNESIDEVIKIANTSIHDHAKCDNDSDYVQQQMNVYQSDPFLLTAHLGH